MNTNNSTKKIQKNHIVQRSRKKHFVFPLKKVFAVLSVLFLCFFTYDVAFDIAFTTAYLLYPHSSLKCSNCVENKGEFQHKFSFLFYTAVLHASSATLCNGNCEINQNYFTRTLRHENAWTKNKANSTTELEKDALYKSKKDHLSQSIVGYDVVIFHVKDMPGSRLLKDVSTSRPNGQIWAYYNKESPYNTINIVDGKYDNIFNMTITPQRNSDLFAPYGYYESKQDNLVSWIKKFNSIIIFERDPHDPYRMKTRLGQEKELLNMNMKFEEKDLLVAWVVSNCDEARDSFVRAMKEHISIHIYGRCGVKYQQARTCDKYSYNCELRLRRYKFVLAFENSFCDDYITEKYWNAIFRGNVPIVLGGSKYDKDHVIPGSYINSRSFDSPKSLAEYINFLGRNKREYQKYMRWREKYVVDFTPNDFHRLDYIVTKLYQMLSTGLYHAKSYNLSDFYSVKKNCPLQLLE